MIFYFSATGNSKKLAQTIAARNEDTIISIEDAAAQNTCEYTLRDSEMLGFVTPVYFAGIPGIVKKFIDNLKVHTSTGYYCFIALTYGSSHGNAAQQLINLLLRHGLTTNAAYAQQTIDTFLPMFTIPDGDERRRLEDAAALQADYIAEQIADRSLGTYVKKEDFQYCTTLFMKPAYAVMRRTKYLHVTDACTGCGLCAEHCPEHAIRIDSGAKRPVWAVPSCLMCLRCLHECPADAIEYRKLTRGKMRYKPK